MADENMERKRRFYAMGANWRSVPLVLGSIVLAAGCTSTPKTEIPASVPELYPGILTGYLQKNALPDSLALLPPQPAADSKAFAADEEAYRATRKLRDTHRWMLASEDADLRFPQAADSFSCALDMPIRQDSTPHLYMLMRRSLTDAVLATYSAKNHYQRRRPFATYGDSTCTPGDEAMLSKDGSYPSGHAALGWAWALILAEMAPERSNALFARGLDFGQSRIICGMHWQSDVTAGRVAGAATVAMLHTNPVFRAEFDEARKEVASAHAKGMKPAHNCQAEAAARR